EMAPERVEDDEQLLFAPPLLGEKLLESVDQYAIVAALEEARRVGFLRIAVDGAGERIPLLRREPMRAETRLVKDGDDRLLAQGALLVLDAPAGEDERHRHPGHRRLGDDVPEAEQVLSLGQLGIGVAPRSEGH